jgi:hypothetical protein
MHVIIKNGLLNNQAVLLMVTHHYNFIVLRNISADGTVLVMEDMDDGSSSRV